MRSIPLQLSLERAWLYGAGCAAIVSLPFFASRWFTKVAYMYDFACFWSAGATAGTSTLTNPQRLNSWAHAHHMVAQPFSYPPGFAWFYTPLSHLPPINGLIAEELAMGVVFVLAALIAARVYGFNPLFAVAAVLGWAPVVNSIEVGQNIGLALALTFAVTWAVLRRHAAIAGFAAGLLLYKPSVAIPILLVLLVRREWKVLGGATACAVGWYLASVAASGGNWLWPETYARTLASWLPIDFMWSAQKAFTIPTLLMAHGASLTAASLTCVAILLAALTLAARASAVEALSMMPLVGLTASVHAWPYEAALALPAIFYAMTTLREPWRTRLIGALYLVVAILLITRYGNFGFAALCIGGTALWLIRGYTFPRRLAVATGSSSRGFMV